SRSAACKRGSTTSAERAAALETWPLPWDHRARNEGSAMSTATLAEPGPKTPKKAARDGRTDVKLGGDWLDRWLMELDQVELRTYLQLAHYYNTRTYHDTEALSRI